MTKQQEFRKQTEEAKFEAFSLMCKKIADLEKENCLLGERCNQLLKDKGYLTDKLQELKETLAQTIENDEVAYETLKLHDQEEIGMLNSKVTELENKIADIKANCDLATEGRDVKIMELKQQVEKMKCCYNCSKDCGSIDRRICFENKMKDWVMKE